MPLVSAPPRDAAERLRQAMFASGMALACILCVLVGPRYASPGATIFAAVFITSIMSAIVGFSFAAIGGAALIHLVRDPGEIVQVMTLCGLANQAAMTWMMRHDLNWRALRIFLAGAALGLPIGIGAWIEGGHHVDARAFGFIMIAIGLVLPALRHIVPRVENRGLDLASGFIGGVTGGAFEFPGASVAIWCNLKGGDKIRQRAIFQPFMLVVLVVVVMMMRIAGVTQVTQVTQGDLFAIPFGLFGTFIGMVLFRRMSNAQFSIAVSLQLLMSGLSYIVP